MTQRNHSAHNPQKRLAYTIPAQGLCWLSSVSLLSGGLVFAQTETSIDNIVPTIENAQPSAGTNFVKKDIVVPAASPAQPKASQRQATLRQRLRKSEVSQTQAPVRQSQPKMAVESNKPVVNVKKSQPQVETSRVTPSPNSEVKPKLEVATPVNVKKSQPQVETSRVTPSPNSEVKPKLEVATPVKIKKSQPQVETSRVAPTPNSQVKPKLEVATPTRSLPEQKPTATQPSNNSESNNSVTARPPKKDYKDAYIDRNDYSNDTATYQAPNSVILTERSSGCRTTLATGQGVSGSACAKTSNERVANSSNKSTPTWLRRSQTAQLATPSPVRSLANADSPSRWRSSPVATGRTTKTAFHSNRFIPNPSEFATTRVSATPIAPSGGTLPAPMAEGNIAPRASTVAYDIPLASVLPQIPYTGTLAYRGGSGMVYPLAVAAPITSVFGWRIHPITGNRRFHAGADLGAPMGTPILAAAKGQVETADWVGGYGLTVILNHSSAQQTLYGHMSEIFVRPGQWVEPGMVIGRVGSTGNSTGPHLHFEVRHMTQNGWVAVDPGVQLQIALSQLLQGVQTAQAIRE
ncbi:metalloendopeptidase-like membrane protein [Nostoc sp. PCC 7524]|uniref:peptidoglycan DD-metalloendopeptidase family protein n=1 Tax=Nostoc sp. (strain ATCC 29411 / PCC 7524) TaxID=28072 RepID=UPI00029EE54D|nr:peptidoglycan DD-metalloendopeptidase family protein [Nostoc sp. PCC 7524]AFY49132.1 metalloendopeptidase-like membrane protein [Nostoc sp. PCC 7524]